MWEHDAFIQLGSIIFIASLIKVLRRATRKRNLRDVCVASYRGGALSRSKFDWCR